MIRKTLLILLLLFCYSTLYAEYLTNKNWVKKENLTSPISININGENLDLDRDIDKIVTYYNTKPFDYFFLPDKKKINNKEKECAGNIKKNIYLLRPGTDKPIELPSDLTWTEDPFNDRNWQFWFHNWKFTSCLLDGYTAFKDPWYLNRIKWLVIDWWRDNFKEEFPSGEFSWYDHTIPIRLHHMLEIFEFVRRNSALDVNFTKVALRSIYWHARILAEEKPLYIKNHNHGLDQSMKLLETSQLFPEFSLSKSWEKISRERLRNEINFALTSEGVHKENSPGYHGWVSVYCAKINDFSEHYMGAPITKTDSKRLQEGGLRYISTIARPDNTLPQLGDTSPGVDINIHFPLQKELSWYPYYQYIKSNGKIGKKPRETTAVFKKSGYYVYRDKWDNPNENSAIQLILKCGFLAKGHRHNDDGNILLYGLGEDWLIDAGTYGYEHNQYRSYVVSPSAHNISFPYNTKLSHPGDSKEISSLEERFSKYKENWGIVESNNTHAVCESHMFRGYTYKRTLEITGKHSFKVSDRLASGNNDSNDIHLTLFKVPDDKDIYINTDKRIVLILNDVKNAALKIHYINNFSEIKLFRGEKGDILSLETIGWLKMRPAKTIAFIGRNTSYSADFELELISSPVLKGYKKIPVNIDKVKISIQNNTTNFTFHISPNLIKTNLKIAFYLYKDGKHIDTQWYGNNFIYKLDKQKYRKGKYRIRYFIVDENADNPERAKKLETGYSKYIELK